MTSRQNVIKRHHNVLYTHVVIMDSMVIIKIEVEIIVAVEVIEGVVAVVDQIVIRRMIQQTSITLNLLRLIVKVVDHETIVAVTLK